MLTRQVQIRNKLLSIISERKTNLDFFSLYDAILWFLIYWWRQAVNNLPSVNNQINAKLGHLSSNGKICVNRILVESLVSRVLQMISLWKWNFLCFFLCLLNCFIVLNMKSKVFPHEETLGSHKIWVLFKCKKLPDSFKQRNFWQSCPIFKFFSTSFPLIL